MRTIKLKKGLKLPITGEPVPSVFKGKDVARVALLGPDYPGMKPDFAVKPGDTVKLGQLLFTDKKRPAIRFTSPGPGTVIAVNRGERRAFLSIVIELKGTGEITFDAVKPDQLGSLKPEAIKDRLLTSGLWTALRERPFGRVADPETRPASLFVTAMDTNPLAPDVSRILPGQAEDFKNGLTLLSRMLGVKIFVCTGPGIEPPLPAAEGIEPVCFEGPHPAGLPSTHIHFLDPANRHKTVWHLNFQDVTAVGRLFTTGKIPVSRIISLAGSQVKNPRMIETRLGASCDDLLTGEIMPGDTRAVSGPVYSGHNAADALAFLGRYHQQVLAIPEDNERRLFGWLSPGLNLFSIKRIVLGSLIPGKRIDFTTSLHGGMRTIVPSGGYEKVMPLDILPTYLLRALAVKDIDEAEKLGCLELIEEDLGLCTFVCPSKIDHMKILRENLDLIEKEG